MTIAITGATGQLGRLVIDTLKADAHAGPVIALARDTQKASDLGVPVREFDYDAPDGLAAALDGVDTLLLISGNDIGRRVPQHLAVIEAARAASVSHVVYTSLLRADTTPILLGPEHAETEKALKASGLGHTILRNGWYTENYAMGLGAAIQNKALIGAAGEGRISSAARADYALAAARVLTDPALQGKTYELAGDESYTLADMAAALSAHVGEAIAYVDMSVEQLAQTLQKAGLPEQMAGFLAQTDAEVARGALFDDGRALSRLIGRPTTPMKDVVARMATQVPA